MKRIAYSSIPLLILAAAVASWALAGVESVPPAESIAVSTDVEPDLDRAERWFAEGSYALALELYQAIDLAPLGDDPQRWIRMRLADARWRSAAATQSADQSDLEQARQQLEVLVRDVQRQEDRDRVWAEVQESLGDFNWTRRDQPNWGQAWPHYQLALDWWAGSSEIERARERYLSIVWRAARPPHVPPYYYYGYYGNQLPLQVLENAREIAVEPRDRAHVAYLIAMAGRQSGADQAAIRRTVQAFEEAIDAGHGTEWYDDALFHYAEWLTRSGRVVRTTGGGFEMRADNVRAVELYRRFVREFDKGETRYYDQAEAQINSITAPTLGVAVSNVFLPGSEIQYYLSYRNVRQIDLALYPVELVRDLSFDGDGRSAEWLERLSRSKGAATHSWTHATHDTGEHLPGQESMTLGRQLSPGAYLLEADAGGKTARDLVLVTDVSVVLKSSGRQALAFVCDAVDGSPRADAEVVLWIRRYENNWDWQHVAGRTGDDGLLSFALPDTDHNLELFVVADAAGDPAFSTGQSWRYRSSDDAWRIYAFTDRPVYRPEDRVQFKIVARQVVAGGYTTPAGQTLHYRVIDPRGTELEKSTLELNGYGAAWAELELGADLPLGEYRVEFRNADDSRSIGGATLFRVEEYKLPEFELSVETPQVEGRPATFRVGDTVEAEIVAQYYFGGPVAGAEAEVVVYQKPLWIWWQPPREFPWFYEDMTRSRHYGWGGPGQVVQRIKLSTDASGRARIRFDTPRGTGQDFEYTLEARVRDSSRREVVGSGTVRVSRQRYFAFVRPLHNLYRPGDEVRIELKTIDANRRPLPAEGRIVVTRERWVERWVDSSGREVSGNDLTGRERRKTGWTLKSRGYEHEQILDRLVRTDEQSGDAVFRFTPAEDGYYRVRFTGDEQADYPVQAQTTVWVADRDTRTVGYHHGGVEILVDRETLRSGASVPVMISAPVEGAWVLFSVEGEELYDYRVVHLDGSVKLLEIDIEERHVPNVFFEAAMVHDGQLYLDSYQVIVPPVDQFLEVRLEPDREEYRPGETGRVQVTTRDHDGNPVSAEVALALVDASVFYIQQDLAGDPRQFFYGTKRPKTVQTQSTFQHKPYAHLVEGPDGVVIDARIADDRSDLEGVVRAGYRDKDELRQNAARKMTGSSAPALESEVAAFGAMSRGRMEEKAMVAADEALVDVAAGSGPGGSTVEVRTDFRATALWQPHVVTDEDGTASVEVVFPDSLTSWRATARVTGDGNRFGIAEAETRTRKPLIVRLQAPRFFVVGDRLTISAVVNNNSDRDLEVSTSLEALGIERLGRAGQTVRVSAGGEARIDWPVRVTDAGQAELTVRTAGGAFDDAMQKGFPVFEHGIDKLIYRAGKVRADEVRITLPLPDARRSTTMSVQVTPSMAVTMLDALPYLIDYPYGCTEQTMSRFLPSVIVAGTLENLGLKRREVASRIFGGIEQAHAAETHTDGKRDLARLDEMVRSGLERLVDFQHADGGWGWWKDGESDHYMSAYVVWGLALAREAGVRVRDDTIRRGVDYLDRELVEQEDHPDLAAWMLHALAAASDRGSPGNFQQAALDRLWEQRERLNAYTRSLFALAAHELGQTDRAQTLVRNLTNGVKRDRSPDTSVVVRGAQQGSDAVIGTAHWGQDRVYWRWSDGAIEATAFALKALLAIDPDNELIEPVTHWMIRNRRGAQWSNTRDTAFAVLALNDYLRISGELSRGVEYELFVNDQSIATRRVEPADLLTAASRFTIDRALIRDGDNQIRIVRRSGNAAIYFAVQAEFFSLEEPIAPAGNELFLRRQYYRMASRPTLLKGFVTDARPLDDRGGAISGERVEVVLTVEAKNDYEYLVIEDLKPAGLEAVQLRSGAAVYARELKQGAAERDENTREAADYTGRARWIHQELRDRKVALFLDRLPQGIWEIRYTLRAEIPGEFHALPALIHAMYVPEIRANGAEIRLEVTDP